MDTIFEAFFVGILSTVIAGVLVWLITKQAWPRLWNRLQKRPDVSGGWTSTFEEDDVEKHETVQVSQIGEKISGVMTLTEEDNTIITSKFTGSIQSNVIKGLYENQNPEGFEQGAFVLNLDPRGAHASGQYIYYVTQENGLTSELTASPYTWRRG